MLFNPKNFSIFKNSILHIHYDSFCFVSITPIATYSTYYDILTLKISNFLGINDEKYSL